MLKVIRLLLIVLAGVVVLGGIVLIGANLYVQSQGIQARIQQELSHRVGAAVRVQRTSITPWGGLTLSGITIPQEPASQVGDFLQARAFRVRVQLASLFRRNVIVKDVSLIEPTVIWPQDGRGKWRLPASRAEEERADAGEPEPTVAPSIAPPVAAVSPSPGATVAPAGEPERSAPPPKPSPAMARSQPPVQHVNVSRGDFRFLNRSGDIISRFEDVNFRSTLGRDLALQGRVTAGKVSLRDRFYLTNLQTPVHYAPDRLELPRISAHAAGGEVGGDFLLQPETEDSPFSFSVKFQNLNADEIVAQAGGPSGMIQGRLDGSFAAQGATANANVLSGNGEIVLHDGQLRQYSLLVALGQILQIEELTQLHLDQAEAKYHVDPGVVTIDELVLRSPNIRLSATGTVGFDGKLRLESQLAINEKIRSQLFKPIRANFQPLSEPGLSAVDFEVTGTIDRPKSNLVEKVVGRDLKDLGSVINSFLGGSKSDRPKKKKRTANLPDEPVSPAPAPGESPSPTASPTP